MGELSFVAWRRYGHDRVYVARGAERLGYLDRTTGALVLDDDACRDEVRGALVAQGWLDPPPPAIEWALTLPGDTATYRPGGGARAMARAEREAAPIRTAVDRLRGLHTEERAWRVGAQGEEEVARHLARLPESWTVVHDLPIGTRGSNVDHVAVGPAGVFSLNTKNHSGTVSVDGDTVRHNGYRQHYVRNSRHEAARVSRLLSAAVGHPVAVHGVVVVIADSFTVKAQPDDVTVVARKKIRAWLADRPAALDDATIGRLARAVRDPRTWAGR